jgi:multidrug efflux pump
LVEPSQFEKIVVKAGKMGPDSVATPLVQLKDVAKLELGAQQYDQSCLLDGHPSVALAVYQTPTANALDTAEGIRHKMDELQTRFPAGLIYKITYDTTPFIHESIVEVLKTLRDAVILVALVVLVFLQNWRAAIIPLVAMPVAIVGTFAVMAAMGFSLNNLSLFGLVLAIGIVVDDAIVVVENVERWLAEGLSPREASVKAMEEVTGPVIAVALVLCAVFVPCAFITGITGQFFRQFALTIAVSTIISAFNSLTLSPALAAVLLKPHSDTQRRDPLTFLLDISFGWFFKLFNWSFELSTSVYTKTVGLLLRGCILALILYGGLLGLTWWSFAHVPFGFIPDQDKGYLLANVQLPEGASVSRTQEVIAKLEKLARSVPGVGHTLGVSGMSILLQANAPNFGSMFIILEPFHDRRSPEKRATAIEAKLRQLCYKEFPGAVVSIFGAPPVDGLGTAGGFKIMVEDRGDQGLMALQGATDALIEQANRTPGLVGVFTLFRSNSPQIYADIDRVKVKSLGVELSDLFNTLQVYLGSLYVNNFNEFGRSWQVNLQAGGAFRRTVDQVGQLKVRNSAGEMVPLATLMNLRDISGPVMVNRYNMYQSAPVNGNVLPGVSSGQAIKLMEGLAQKILPDKMTYEWTELTLMQIRAGNTAAIVFALAVILVFLVLAAQYESWTLPLAVILVVPMCLLCSVVGVMMAKLDVNIFTQIGFVVLVGLASKNAILIVEFARQQRDAGTAPREATLTACRLRLRPIMMTSLAFILGVVPLVLAEGAGAEMRHALGTAVFSGMIGVTLFGIFLTPVFFYVIDRMSEQRLFKNRWVVQVGNFVRILLSLGLIPLMWWIRRNKKGSSENPNT